MFDFGAINKSAETMAQAATDIVSRLESIENLTREQNALLAVLVHVAINGAASLSDGEQLTASQLIGRIMERQQPMRFDAEGTILP